MTNKERRIAGPTRLEVLVGGLILPLLLGGLAVYQVVVTHKLSDVLVGGIVVYGCALVGRFVDFSVFRR